MTTMGPPPRYADRRTGLFFNAEQMRTEYVLDGVVEAWIGAEAGAAAVGTWLRRYVGISLTAARWLPPEDDRP